MLSCGKICCPTEVWREIERFNSSTRAAFVETDAGLGYVKGLGNPQGSQTLVSELVAAELAVWFGLSIPSFAVIRKCEIEIRMRDCAMPMQAPLFFSKKVDGNPRDGSDLIVSRLRNPSDLSKLVIFDTWIRNSDRYFNGVANSDNLLFVLRRKKKKYDVVPIDHTHCFVDDFPVNAIPNETIYDPDIYGDFPEFSPYLNGKAVGRALDHLTTLDRNFVEQIVNSVPREWGMGYSSSKSLADFICRRAAFVVQTIAKKIVQDPEFAWIGK